MRRLLLLVLLTSLALGPAFAMEAAEGEVKRFLDSRKRVGIIYFSKGSAVLSPQAKKSIDAVVPRLKSIDMAHHVVRIEGYADTANGEELNVPLSMERAQSVREYMRARHGMDTGLFLIGCGSRDLHGLIESKRRRVEIALYDNLWDLENAPVDNVILKW